MDTCNMCGGACQWLGHTLLRSYVGSKVTKKSGKKRHGVGAGLDGLSGALVQPSLTGLEMMMLSGAPEGARSTDWVVTGHRVSMATFKMERM